MNVQEFLDAQVRTIDDNEPFRCIDDRDGGEESGKAYRVPGAGLGIIVDVIAGIEAMLGVELSAQTLEKVYSISLQHIGELTFHTGKSHAVQDSPVKGCGYLAQSLEGNAQLTQSSAAFLKEKAHQYCMTEVYVPVDFQDDHSASYIFLVKDTAIGIVSTAIDGTRAYVFHVDAHKNSIHSIAENIHKTFPETFPSTENLAQTILEVSTKRLGQVVQELNASALPQYVVWRDDNKISFEEMKH